MAITTGKYFYCSHVTPKNHDMNLLLVNQITSKMQLQKLPGSYLINNFWYKTVLLPQETNRALPTYIQRQLSTSIVVNISENIQKQNLHRPIACLNFMYKIYTSCLNLFLYDHCHCHKIITTEQAAGKKGVWGCTEQLLINKSIMSEVRSEKTNLITIWLDDKNGS